jgi:hypothetical protein
MGQIITGRDRGCQQGIIYAKVNVLGCRFATGHTGFYANAKENQSKVL